MIHLTMENGWPLYVSGISSLRFPLDSENAGQGQTRIVTDAGETYVVLETVEEILELIRKWRMISTSSITD